MYAIKELTADDTLKKDTWKNRWFDLPDKVLKEIKKHYESLVTKIKHLEEEGIYLAV